MITYQSSGASKTDTPNDLETNPKEIIATAMIELAAQGRTVNAEALGEATALTEDEIEANWRAARDLARIRVRRTPQAA